MTTNPDPLLSQAHADLVLERTAGQLRDILHAAVAALDPFPPYPGAFFSYGIEVDSGPLASKDRGCVVVGPDGELYELIMRLDFSGEALDPVSVRDEEMRKLELSPAEYVILAHAAIRAVVEHTLGQAG